MQIRLVAALLLSLLLASRAEAQFRVPNPAPGEQFHVELGLMFWKPTPGLQIQTGSLAALGESEVDFVQEFGIENERFNEFRAVMKAAKKHKIRVSHVLAEYDAATTLQRTIVFGGQTFPVSVPATADLKWGVWRFGYEWDFVAMDRGVVGVVTELKVQPCLRGPRSARLRQRADRGVRTSPHDWRNRSRLSAQDVLVDGGIHRLQGAGLPRQEDH